MSLRLPAGLKDLIRGGNYDAQAALDVTLQGGTVLHIATAEMVLPGPVAYAPSLRMRGSVKQSLRKITNSVELTAQNVDSVLGLTILASAQVLNAAKATFIYAYFALDGSGTVYRLERMEGELTAASISETEVKLKLISDMDSGGSVAANRAVGKLCQYAMGRRGCDSPSAGPCSKDLFDTVGGCPSKLPAVRISSVDPTATDNSASFGGMAFRDSVTSILAGSITGGIVNGQDPA